MYKPALIVQGGQYNQNPLAELASIPWNIWNIW